eukprot:GILI01003221.1.p1 GENE.GILI01003221.1~~GILI01003221.1.p1  ORF type:complete len:261 (-),score=31.10 GILI01003221.1:86-835(-)
MPKYEGLQLIAGLVDSSEDASALLQLCEAGELEQQPQNSEEDPPRSPKELAGDPIADILTPTQTTAPFQQMATSHEYSSYNAEPITTGYVEQPVTSAYQPQPPPRQASQQLPTVTTIARHRPNTAEKIHLRTARLMNELAEIDKFRELRTISNHYQKGHSPLSHSSPTIGRSTVLPPIQSPNHSRGGLFSETLAQSNNNQSVIAAGSRVPTAGAAGPKSQTRGDGRAGFSCKESRIASLVQQLNNKWGR